MQELEIVREKLQSKYRVVKTDEDLEWNRAIDLCTNIINAHIKHMTDGWIPVDDRMPECEEEVFIQTERGTRTTAIYEDGTVREEDSIWYWYDIDGEWDEERDCMIIPEGWWEDRRFNPDDVYNNVVDEKVVAWRPLPPNYCAKSKNIECEIEGEKDGFI